MLGREKIVFVVVGSNGGVLVCPVFVVCPTVYVYPGQRMERVEIESPFTTVTSRAIACMMRGRDVKE